MCFDLKYIIEIVNSMHPTCPWHATRHRSVGEDTTVGVENRSVGVDGIFIGVDMRSLTVVIRSVDVDNGSVGIVVLALVVLHN